MEGRAVSRGARLLAIDVPGKVKIESYVDVADGLLLSIGAAAKFIPSISPDASVRGHVSRIAYESRMATGMSGFRVWITPDEQAGPLRLGTHGTATVKGERQSLIMIFLRKPLFALRKWSGS